MSSSLIFKKNGDGEFSNIFSIAKQKSSNNLNNDASILLNYQEMIKKQNIPKDFEIDNSEMFESASLEAKKYASSMTGAEGEVDKFVSSQKSAQIGLDVTNVKMKATEVATRALNTALNMAAIALISFAVTEVVEKFNEWSNEYKELAKNIDDNTQSIQSNKEEINSLNEQLDENANKIDTILGKDTLSITDSQDLENLRNQNTDLEHQIELLKQKNAEKEKENTTDALKLYNGYDDEYSDYNNTKTYSSTKKGAMTNPFSKLFASESKNPYEYVDNIENNIDDYKNIVQGNLNSRLKMQYGTQIKPENILSNLNDIISDQESVAENGTGQEAEEARQRVVELLALVKQLNGESTVSAKYASGLADIKDQYGSYIEEQISAGNSVENSIDKNNLLGDSLTRLGVPTSEAVKYFKELYDAESDIADKTTDLTSAFENLSTAESAIKSLDKAYSEVNENGKLSFDTLSSIQKSFSDVDGIDDYIQKLSKTGLTTKKLTPILSDLAYQKMKLTMTDSDIVNSGKDVISSMLSSAGVTNSSAIATEIYNKAMAGSVAAQIKISTNSNVLRASLEAQGKQLGFTTQEMANLVAQEQIFNNTKLNVADKIAALKNLAKAANINVMSYNDWLKSQGITNNAVASHSSSLAGKYEDYIEGVYGKYSSDSKKADKTVKFSGSSSGNSSASSSAKSSQVFDWIEKKITRLSELTDRLKKKTELYFYFISKNNIVKQSMKSIGKEIQANTKAYDEYMKQASRSTLSSSWKNKVKNGSYDIDSISNDTLKSKIENYQNWYEKAIKCKDAINELKAEEQQMAKQALQNVIDYYDAYASLHNAGFSKWGSYQELRNQKGYNMTSSDAKNTIKKQIADQESLLDIYREEYNQYTYEYAKYQDKLNGADKVAAQEKMQQLEDSMNQAKTQISEFQDTLDHLNIDSLSTQFSTLSSLANIAESKLKVRSAKGYSETSDDQMQLYNEQKNDARQQSLNAQNRISEITKLMNKFLNNGGSKNSTKYQDYMSELEQAYSDYASAEEAWYEAKYKILEQTADRLEYTLKRIDHEISQIKNNSDLNEVWGNDNTSNYKAMIDENTKEIAKYKELAEEYKGIRDYIQSNTDEVTNNSNYEEYNQKYYDSLEKVASLLKENAGYADDLRQAYFSTFDDVSDSIQNCIDNLEHLNDLANASDTEKLLNKNGSFNGNGAVVLNDYIAQIKQDQEAISNSYDKLSAIKTEWENSQSKKAVAKNAVQALGYNSLDENSISDILYKINSEALDSNKIKSVTGLSSSELKAILTEAQVAMAYTEDEYESDLSDAQKATNDATSTLKEDIDSVVSLYKDSAQKELDYMNELIDKYKEALNKKKDYYDYDKTIKDATKNINSLQAQINALEGVSTSEAKAKKALLEADLSKAQDDLDNTVNEHMYNLQIDGLDELSDNLQDDFEELCTTLEQSLDLQQQVIGNAVSFVGSSQEMISQTLKQIADFYGVSYNSNGATLNYDTNNDLPHFANGGIVDKIKKSGDDGLASLKVGETVMSQKFTDMLPQATMNIAKFNELSSQMLNNNFANMINGSNIVSNGNSSVSPINLSFDNMLNIEGNVDKNTVNDLEKMTDTISNNIVKKFSKELRKLGYK